ncbi:hypothetical protein SPRG_16291 [Saprolegnia parasitica CBS 223.65]|uniref:Uncharacterized protein n=1 Tax=Saprolegnia parasitica (strain CBS 223.65) TaxID=695850 RepID=A0A067BVJ0_SAPPC|nr:hypothetical protein SPRG_16291 [Saprolegnia parasitica CBS 223.65]KDO18301.1 hypothetical protein SPRG_16291 [Saprolegnia parasitica CBS 223.65]|eukprot:XP_012210990.1 hypothetical protein SPRG_16291 [Saprolegnia parasitica CBS 223.65]
MAGVRWNPWDRGYSGLEVEQMGFLHKTYCEVYNVDPKDLPHILQMDDKFRVPLYSPQVADFDEHTFVRKMQDMTGLLKNPAEGIISSICAYQKDRHERVLFNAYLNDPRTLLLEEIKAWALNTLASATCTTEYIVNQVECRMQYIKKIQYGQQKLFTSGSGERSLMATLKDVREILEYRVLPIIETERAHASAKEQLTILEAKGTDALIHGVQFLFYVFRNTPNAPNDCTISNLQSQQHAAMKDAMNTKSGQMMQLLLNTPSFKELFPESPYATNQKDKAPQPLMLQWTPEEAKSMETSAVFCDMDTTAIIPAVLTKSNSQVAPVEFFKASNSGLVALPADSAPTAYESFVRMHGMLKLMADLIVSCRKARLLAGPGGDLLVYGPGGDEVRRLMQSWQAVQGEMRRLVNDMTQLGVQELDKMKSTQERNWRHCFKEVLSLQNYIANDIAATVEPIQMIHRNTDPARVQRLLHEFREATGHWVNENSTICNQISGTLGLPMVVDGQRVLHKPEITMIEEGDEGEPEGETVLNTAMVVARAPKSNPPTTMVKPRVPTFQEESTNLVKGLGNSVFSLFGVSTTSAQNASTTSEMLLPDVAVPPAPKSAPISRNDAAPEPPMGALDALLLVRQVVQAIGALSWNTRSTVQTTIHLDDRSEMDAFNILCAVYEAVGVVTSPTLLSQLQQYRQQLLHVLGMYLRFLLNGASVLQQRMVQQDSLRSLQGMLLLMQRLEPSCVELQSELGKLQASFDMMMDACAEMKAGMQEVLNTTPLLDPREETDGPAMYALNSIGSLSNMGWNKTNTPSPAIQSHMAYMDQMVTQMGYHKQNLAGLQQMIGEGAAAIEKAETKLQCLVDDFTYRKLQLEAKMKASLDPKGVTQAMPNIYADIGYIFGAVYEGFQPPLYNESVDKCVDDFFHQETKHLKAVVGLL